MTSRLIYKIFALAIAVVALASVAFPVQAKEPDGGTGVEAEFIAEINKSRQAAGLAPVAAYWDLTDDARTHSEQMLAAGNIYHTSPLSAVTTGWASLSENVGAGPSVSSLHAAFMASAGHKANILGDNTHVGVGVSVSPSGQLWVTVIFARYGPYWWPVAGQDTPDFRIGHFASSSNNDKATYNASNGVWTVNPVSGANYTLADYSTTSGWEHVVGDFNGDGLTDIGSFHTGGGTWWITLSNGPGQLGTTSLWADFVTPSGWEHYVGDFTGDGKDDILSYHPSNATYWVSRSTGSSFVTSLWTDWGNTTWMVNIADYNSDGKDDIISFAPTNDTWWYGRSTGYNFATSKIF